MKKNILQYFYDFLNENEDSNYLPKSDSPLRGYDADTIILRIEELMKLMPDDFKFGIPSDIYGHSIVYRDANSTIEKIRDIDHYYKSKGEEVKFYCWNITYKGSWEATSAIKKKMMDNNAFGKHIKNMNLKKLIEYFSKNKEDVDNIKSISIGIDSKSIREISQDLSK